MNHEPEAGATTGKVSLSPKEKLEEAIQEYLASLEWDGEEDPGVLTGWFLVAEQQNVISGTSSFAKAVRDHQSLAKTMGLIVYADERYRAQVRGS